MDYNAILGKIENLKQEGNYRICGFERYQGSFPRAKNYSKI